MPSDKIDVTLNSQLIYVLGDAICITVKLTNHNTFDNAIKLPVTSSGNLKYVLLV